MLRGGALKRKGLGGMRGLWDDKQKRMEWVMGEDRSRAWVTMGEGEMELVG